MLVKYRKQFKTLTNHEAATVWQHVKERHQQIPEVPFHDKLGELLFAACTNGHLSQAEVVMSMIHEQGRVAVSAMEKLIGHPLRKPPPPLVIPLPQSHHRISKLVDPRIITEISPNPKRVGSKAFEMYLLYRVGERVDQFLKRGGRMSAVRYDTAHGYVKVR